MKKTKILICGASGFIGRNIFERLANRKDIDLIGTYKTNHFTKDKRLVKTDLTDRKQVNKLLKGVDVLIQAAAVTSGAKDIKTRPYIHVTDNVIMNSLLYQAAYDHNIGQAVFFSCSVPYTASERPIKETDLNLNDGMYPTYFGVGWMKIYIEKQCEFYSRLGRTKFTIIRHSNIYGPHDKYDLERSHVFGATITKVMTAKPGDTLSVWGTGKEKRDLLYIDDLVDFVETAIAGQDYAYDIFNIGAGSAISINNLITKIINASGKNLSVVHDTSKPTIPVNIVLDITKAGKKFGWHPKITLDQGIAKTIRWYNENIIYKK